jgi:hypothetical protein
MMRVDVGADAADEGVGKGRKLMHNASSKVAVVVEKMLLPLLDVPLRHHVVFDAEVDQAELDLMEEVDKQHPGVMADSHSFARHFDTLFDRYKAYVGGYTAVALL